MITIFKDILETKTPYHKPLEYALNRIKEGRSRSLVETIRSEDDKSARDKLKMQLPCVMFSGRFRERNTSGLIEHSGFICLDFDGIDNREELAADPYIYACWLSPSGNGVKALVKIPTDDHYGSFLAIEKRYPNIDRACKDVSRVCYESYDPDIYINEESDVFADQVKVEYETMTIDKPETDSEKIYEAIKKWLSKNGQEFYEGNRNNFLFQLASACNRFGIHREDAEGLIRYDFVHGGTGFMESEFHKVMDSSYGRYSHQFGTAAFDKSEVVEIESRKIYTIIYIVNFEAYQNIEKEKVEMKHDIYPEHKTNYYSNIEELEREMKASDSWLNTLARNENISRESVDRGVTEFIKLLESSDDYNKSFKEVKKHFTNWLRKRKNDLKDNKKIIPAI